MPLVTSGVDHGNLRELALARMKDLGTQVCVYSVCNWVTADTCSYFVEFDGVKCNVHICSVVMSEPEKLGFKKFITKFDLMRLMLCYVIAWMKTLLEVYLCSLDVRIILHLHKSKRTPWFCLVMCVGPTFIKLRYYINICNYMSIPIDVRKRVCTQFVHEVGMHNCIHVAGCSILVHVCT